MLSTSLVLQLIVAFVSDLDTTKTWSKIESQDLKVSQNHNKKDLVTLR